MAKLYRISKDRGAKNDSKSVRFDLEEQSPPNEFDQHQDEVEKSIVGGVQVYLIFLNYF